MSSSERVHRPLPCPPIVPQLDLPQVAASTSSLAFSGAARHATASEHKAESAHTLFDNPAPKDSLMPTTESCRMQDDFTMSFPPQFSAKEEKSGSNAISQDLKPEAQSDQPLKRVPSALQDNTLDSDIADDSLALSPTAANLAVPSTLESKENSSQPTPDRPKSNSLAASTSLSPARQVEPILPSTEVKRVAPTSMYWSKTATSGRQFRPLRAHSAVVVGDSIWCFGGCDVKGKCYNEVWKLDTDSFVWSKVKVWGNVPPATRAHSATVVDERIFIIGGGAGSDYSNETYIFDTVSLEWSKPVIEGILPCPRRAHAAILYNQQIFIFGGGNGNHALNDVWSLNVSNLENLAWTELHPTGVTPTRRGYHSFNLVPSAQKAILFGGSDGTKCFSDCFTFDLQEFHWEKIEFDANQISVVSRLSHSSLIIGSFLFVIGGHDGTSFSNQVLMLNLVTMEWETRKISGQPPSIRGYHQAIFHDSRIFIIGGYDGHAVFDQVYQIDLAGNAFFPQISNFSLGTGAVAEAVTL